MKRKRVTDLVHDARQKLDEAAAELSELDPGNTEDLQRVRDRLAALETRVRTIERRFT